MNNENEVILQNEKNIQQLPAPAANSPMGMMLSALQHGATLDQVEKMMDLQQRYDESQAKKAYDKAFADFKAEAVSILKGRKVTDGPLKGKSYAELHDVIDAATPALSKHGLSSFWKLTKDESALIEVTCYLRHIGGHQESVSMSGAPDTGGAKNVIQARASTVTYLQRYTLKAITGLSERGDDTDGNTQKDQLTDKAADWIAAINECATLQELKTTHAEAFKDLQAAKDSYGVNQINKTKDNKKKALTNG